MNVGIWKAFLHACLLMPRPSFKKKSKCRHSGFYVVLVVEALYGCRCRSASWLLKCRNLGPLHFGSSQKIDNKASNLFWLSFSSFRIHSCFCCSCRFSLVVRKESWREPVGVGWAAFHSSDILRLSSHFIRIFLSFVVKVISCHLWSLTSVQVRTSSFNLWYFYRVQFRFKATWA